MLHLEHPSVVARSPKIGASQHDRNVLVYSSWFSLVRIIGCHCALLHRGHPSLVARQPK
jgi:septal ring factor EnvC (AmiA/AmiB activator)